MGSAITVLEEFRQPYKLVPPSVVTYGVIWKSRPAAGIARALRAATLAAAKEEVVEQGSPVPITGVEEPMTG